MIKNRRRQGLNLGPDDLQSPALPLSYVSLVYNHIYVYNILFLYIYINPFYYFIFIYFRYLIKIYKNFI